MQVGLYLHPHIVGLRVQSLRHLLTIISRFGCLRICRTCKLLRSFDSCCKIHRLFPHIAKFTIATYVAKTQPRYYLFPLDLPYLNVLPLRLMAQRARLDNLPQHPTIDYSNIQSMLIGGHVGPAALVTCPYCQVGRWIAIRTLRNQAAHPNYKGSCRQCYRKLPKASNFRTRRNPLGRRISKQNGYVQLGKNAISDDDLPMFDQMRGKAGGVSEHRWIMAKHLGRPLTAQELVDHRDGHHDHNEIDNLRLYVRGKQQPGSAPGHGTYYHEWQMAQRRVQELEAELAHTKSNLPVKS